MDYRSLTLDDRAEWSRLLAVCFDRTPDQMGQLLEWFHSGFELVTWGAWDGDRLVAQYNCRLLRLHVPRIAEPALAGMGLNMAVDPEYRGRGLLETVAGPVHEQITARGCIAGVGFSSEGGLEVTRRSSSYALSRARADDLIDGAADRPARSGDADAQRNLAGGSASVVARHGDP